MESIKKTLENGVCSDRAFSPGTNGNGGFLKNNTKTENKQVIKSVRKGKLLRCSYHAKRPRHTHAFTVQFTMMASADRSVTANLTMVASADHVMKNAADCSRGYWITH